MRLEHLWLTDFRSYRSAELEPAPEGLTVVTGDNGQGKTNLLEATAYLASLRSFRGAPGEALIRVGAPQAVVRAQVDRGGRALLIEAELRPTGRDRVQINRQPLRRTRDLLGSLQVTVFAPDDLTLVKGGPAMRREYLDDLLVALHPRHDSTQAEVDRVLRQRNALLKSAAGRTSPDVTATLDVWDAKLAAAGEALVAARAGLTVALQPVAIEAYRSVAASARGDAKPDGEHREVVRLVYERSYEGSLAEALAAARANDIRRGLSTVGPHRDELAAWIAGMPARTHASQGEQRSLALALRLAGHAVVTGRLETPPVLLLDDVFSELDPARSAALLAALPPGQAILTTAGDLPAGATPEVVVRVDHGSLSRVRD